MADELGRSSAQVAASWVRQRGSNIVPIVGTRKLSQLQDVLGGLDLVLGDEHLARLNDASRIELGFPRAFIGNDGVRAVVYGDLADQTDLPQAALPPR